MSKCIDKRTANNSPGSDIMISPRILKAKCELVKLATLLFDESLQFGSMPDDWKLANVTPNFKKRQQNIII